MNERQFPFDVFPTVADALRALQNEQIDAVVYDAPMLRYGVRQEFSTDLRVLPGDFERQYYGVALPAGSALREPVNRALLNHIETPAWQRLLQGYLGI